MAKRYAVCKLCDHAHSSREPHVLIGGPVPSKDVRDLAAVGRPALIKHGLLTQAGARVLMDEIKRDIHAALTIPEKLQRAKDGQAWIALGYATWEECVEREVGLSRVRAFQILSHAKVLPALTDTIHVNQVNASAAGDVSALTERETRPIRSDPAKVQMVRQAIADGKPPKQAIKEITQTTCKHVYRRRCIRCGVEDQ